MRRLHVFVALFLSLPARAVTIDWVAVGNASNAADTPSANCWAANCGSVDHAYSISKYEITNSRCPSSKRRNTPIPSEPRLAT